MKPFFSWIRSIDSQQWSLDWQNCTNATCGWHNLQLRRARKESRPISLSYSQFYFRCVLYNQIGKSGFAVPQQSISSTKAAMSLLDADGFCVSEWRVELSNCGHISLTATADRNLFRNLKTYELSPIHNCRNNEAMKHCANVIAVKLLFVGFWFNCDGRICFFCRAVSSLNFIEWDNEFEPILSSEQIDGPRSAFLCFNSYRNICQPWSRKQSISGNVIWKCSICEAKRMSWACGGIFSFEFFIVSLSKCEVISSDSG
jgi:hypothetical protein